MCHFSCDVTYSFNTSVKISSNLCHIVPKLVFVFRMRFLCCKEIFTRFVLFYSITCSMKNMPLLLKLYTWNNWMQRTEASEQTVSGRPRRLKSWVKQIEWLDPISMADTHFILIICQLASIVGLIVVSPKKPQLPN